MRGGVAQLLRWGLLDQVIAAGTSPMRETVFRYADAEVSVDIKDAAGVDALYAPRRTCWTRSSSRRPRWPERTSTTPPGWSAFVAGRAA